MFPVRSLSYAVRAGIALLLAVAGAAIGAEAAVADAGWQPYTQLAAGWTCDSTCGNLAYSAFGAGGHALAVTTTPFEGRPMQVWFHAPGGGWTPEPSPGSGDGTAQVAVGADGTAVVIANDNCCGRPLVHVRRPDGTWERSVTVPGGPFPGPHPDRLDVAVGDDGTVLIGYVDGAESAWVWERSPDGTWAAPVRVGTGPFRGTRFVRVGIDREGRALAVWPRGGSQIMAESRAAGAAWAPDGGAEAGTTRTIDGTPANVDLFDMDVAPSGAAVVAWVDHAGSGERKVMAIRRLSAGAEWTSTEPMGPSGGAGDRAIGTDNFMLAAGAADDGTATVAWLPENTPEGHVFVSERGPADGDWTVTLLGAVSERAPDDRYKALDLDVNGRGDAILGWWIDGRYGSHNGPLVTAVKPADGSWQASERDVDTDSNGYFHVSVGVDEPGDAFAGWEYVSPTAPGDRALRVAGYAGPGRA